MLGQKIKTLVNDKLQQEKNEVIQLQKKKDAKTLREIQNAENIFNYIKSITKKIANGERKIITNKDGAIFVTDSKMAVSDNYYGKLFTNASKKDFVELLKETKLPLTQLSIDINNWLIENDIASIEVHYEHDGVGIKSWNSYWIILK